MSTQSTPHPRVKVTPAGRGPCELGWELRDQAPEELPPESQANYRWLCRLGLELCGEYTFRYGKHHKCEEHLVWLCMHTPQGLPEDWTPPKPAMPDEYKHSDPVMAYRTYYVCTKQRMLQYTKRPSPDFLTQAIYMTAVG